MDFDNNQEILEKQLEELRSIKKMLKFFTVLTVIGLAFLFVVLLFLIY